MKKISNYSLIYLLLLFCLIIVFFFDVIFLGRTLSTSSLLPGATPSGPYGFSGYKPSLPFTYDIGGNAWINEPNPYIIGEILAQKAPPLWNPREGLGMPIVGNLNNEVLNPLKSLLNLYPSPFLQDIFYLLRLLFMGIFTFLFLVEMGVCRFSALSGATSFMLSGYSLWWINLHPLSSIMYIPAFFYFYQRWKNRGSLWNLFFLSIVVALSIFGGKIPDVIMGVSLLFFYATFNSFKERGLWGGAVDTLKLIIVCLGALFLAGSALLPFLELNSLASPLAKALRTGSSGHTLPLITSISLWQPLFLGGENYLYDSWYRWSPQAMAFYAGTISLIFFIYSLMNFDILKKTLPFNIFALLIFCQIYGLFSLFEVGYIPIYSSMNFLKYNSMLYFSFAVISANALDSLMRMGHKSNFSFKLSLLCVISIFFIYLYFLKQVSPEEKRAYIIIVFTITLSVIILLGILFFFIKDRRKFSLIIALVLLSELFLYMPKDRPDRYHPYTPPRYLELLRDEQPYRIIGDGESIPPLVSNALGLYDLRAMNVLLQRDYYIFFQNLVSFSVPYTNSPNLLVSGTSPFIDLLGVKYILSKEPIDFSKLPEALEQNIQSLRWIRLFNSMVTHGVKGGMNYGFFKVRDDERFSFIFPLDFKFKTDLIVTEPFLFIALTLKGFIRTQFSKSQGNYIKG